MYVYQNMSEKFEIFELDILMPKKSDIFTVFGPFSDIF